MWKSVDIIHLIKVNVSVFSVLFLKETLKSQLGSCTHEKIWVRVFKTFWQIFTQWEALVLSVCLICEANITQRLLISPELTLLPAEAPLIHTCWGCSSSLRSALSVIVFINKLCLCPGFLGGGVREEDAECHRKSCLPVAIQLPSSSTPCREMDGRFQPLVPVLWLAHSVSFALDHCLSVDYHEYNSDIRDGVEHDIFISSFDFNHFNLPLPEIVLVGVHT